MSAQESAKSILERIGEKKLERRNRREMFNDALMNDPKYKEAQGEVETKQAIRKGIKDSLLKVDSIFKLKEALKVADEEVKALQKQLFAQFFEMEKETGEQLSLFDNDGVLLKVKKSYNLSRG